MKIESIGRFSLAFLFIFSVSALNLAQAPKPDRLITKDSVGSIKIGSTVGDVKKVFEGASFLRGPGEGADEIEVKLNGEPLLWLVAEPGDENYEAPVDEKTKIIGIHVYDQKYKTAKGVGVGTTIVDAEKQYGKLRQIWIEGLTGDEYATFSDHPEGIDFRVSDSLESDDPEDRAGIYESDSDTTARYVENAVISMVKIPGSYGKEFVTSDAGAARSGTFLLSNASRAFKLKIEINGCGDDVCEGAAMVQIFRKDDAVPFQTASFENMYLELGEDQKPTANLVELYGMNNSGVVFDDFDFDGNEDIAFRNGNNGAYGGPSYDIYLYALPLRLFQRNAALTALASENLGLFAVDKEKKELETFTKSGCCWHQTTRYRISYGIPRKVYVRTDDATGPEGTVVITTERWIDGIRTKKVQQKRN